MIVLAGGHLVLPDRVIAGGSLIIDGPRIVAIEERTIDAASGADVRHVSGFTVVPGFVDVHTHGVGGTDVLDGPTAVDEVAARLPRYGVTAFCPTSVACGPDVLETFLAAVVAARALPRPGSAHVMAAHLESNFINPGWNGAQPAACLRTWGHRGPVDASAQAFDADDVMRVMLARRESVGIVTVAPELPGGLELVRLLRGEGHLVSIGHSGATCAEAREAIRAGVTHATHLFNRMTPLLHHEPGVVGAVLESPDVAAEIICDGHHVHPAVVGIACRAKSIDRVMAITDGTAVAGLPPGARARLGGRPIIAAEHTAVLEDGTMAGSLATMDRAFRMLVQQVGLPLEAAARLCATSPARQLGLGDRGLLAVGAAADLVVLDSALEVAQTWIDGQLVSEHGSLRRRLPRP